MKQVEQKLRFDRRRRSHSRINLVLDRTRNLGTGQCRNALMRMAARARRMHATCACARACSHAPQLARARMHRRARALRLVHPDRSTRTSERASAVPGKKRGMKRVLVTGGNTGIGLALCRQLSVDHGCHVILGSRSEWHSLLFVDSPFLAS